MGNLVLTRKQGECIVLLQAGVEICIVEVKSFDSKKIDLFVTQRMGGSKTCTITLASGQNWEVLGGTISWDVSKRFKDQARIGLNLPSAIKIVRQEIAK